MATEDRSGVTTITTPSDREIAFTRVFGSPRRLVFETHTDPKHLPQMTGEYREVTPLGRLVFTERWGAVARNGHHDRPRRKGWRDDADEHDALPIEGCSRRGARHRDE